MRFEKSDYLDITKDYNSIKKRLNEIKLPRKILDKINSEIKAISLILKEIVDIKTHGSFATTGIYINSDVYNVDILGVSYVSQKLFDIYENEIETYDHFDDCIVCEKNDLVFKKITEMYKRDSNVTVKWLEYEIDKIKFRNSIIITFNIEGKNYNFIYRSCLSSKKNYQIICVRNVYRISLSLNYVKTFKILDKLLLKKLSLLFFELFLLCKIKKFSNKKYLYMRLAAMSKLQWEISQNNPFMRTWATKIFKIFFYKNENVDNLFSTNNYYNKNIYLFDKLYRKIRFKNLKWVFNKLYPDLKYFVEKFLKYAIDHKSYENIGIENNHETLFFIYDINAFITNQQKTKNVLIHNWRKNIEDKKLFLNKKYVYTDDSDIGTFMLFILYYNFEII